MNSRRLIVSKILCVFSFLLVLTALLKPPPTFGGEPAVQRKVGIILALTGPIAPVGQSIQNAAEMAKAKFDTNNNVTLIFEDDQFQSKTAVNAAEKLINQDKVDAIVTFSGATSAAVSEVAERRKVPMIGITALSTIGRSKNFVYSLYLDAGQQIALLSTSADGAGFKRIGMITTVQESMLEFRARMKEKKGSLIVREEEVIPGDTNLNSVVTKILAQKPEAVMLFVLPPQVSAASRLFRDQGFKGKFIGAPPLYNPPEIKAAQGALTGAWLPGPSSKGSEEFLGAYLERYHEPCISEGLYGYDTVALLIQAAASGDIANSLQQTRSFSGLLGEYPKTTGNVFQVPGELKEISVEGTLLSAKIQ